MLLNSGLVLDQARALAGRVYAGAADRNDLGRAGRPGLPPGPRPRAPGADELARAVEFLRDPARAPQRPRPAAALPDRRCPKGPTPAQAAAMVDFCHVLLNLNEFVFVD